MPPVSHTNNYPPGLGIAVKVIQTFLPMIPNLIAFFFFLMNSYSLIFFLHCYANYRLPLAATSVCSPGWSHLQNRAPRAATWASTPRASVVIMQTPTLRESVYFKYSRLLVAVWVAIKEPGHDGISSNELFVWQSLDLSSVCSCEWPLEGAEECSLLLSGHLCHSMGILGGCFFFFSFFVYIWF